MPSNWSNRTIWTGDNLPIMRGMNSESVDLIYLDPPFNSKANYAAKKTEYLKLEKELADPDTTDERKAVIETTLKKLTKELKNSANLPKAIDNEKYSPEDVENFEC
ncbi:MAG: hypothetical protein F4Z14_02975 [Gammaproteobacteria bacterium]|nr:hypothetical protein [Gammaproteobacteria bacterium]